MLSSNTLQFPVRIARVLGCQATETEMDASETQTEEPSVKGVVSDDEEDDAGGPDEEHRLIPDQHYYSYEELRSRASVTEHSQLPLDLLQLSHVFGYECGRRANLQLLDEHTLLYIAGNLLVLLDVNTRGQRYIRSCSGCGIGAIMTHPSRQYFAVAEKGRQPNIIIYEYPSLRPYRILRGGTGVAYSCVCFSADGSLLASVGSAPDYTLTLWDWRSERATLRKKAFSQDVHRVSFCADGTGQLTTCGSGHIRFWKMASTFTGLKLVGLLGSFGKTTVTDIEGYVELPDGKVVSGSDWGNLLLWDAGLVKVEICRRGGRVCHSGSIQQISVEEEELITVGSDGAVRSWSLESVDAADAADDSGVCEIEPMNELLVGRNVSLVCVVRSPESSVWFAQDAHGCIWKLDLSFSNMTQDPECVCCFHAGPVQGMDVCKSSHLMATTALDCSVRVFDVLSKRELTVSRFRQGGTTLTWATDAVGRGLLAVGFEDGVVRLLELYNPQGLHAVVGRSHCGDAELRLTHALKPHNAAVHAVAYDSAGHTLATGSADGTVFFFAVGDSYRPLGFVCVPGPIRGLQWSPPTHEMNTLLVLCADGHVVELQSPAADTQTCGNSFQFTTLPTMHFCFSSIKSRIKRDEALALRQARRAEKQKQREERLRKLKQQNPDATEEELQEEEEEEEEEELPPLYTPSPPSPLLCGFYCAAGEFWLSMGGYDSGFLYRCQFSKDQSSDPAERRDEPLSFIPVQDSELNPITSISFSSSGQLLVCGMEDGSIRVYPAQDLHQGSLQAFWALGVHDNSSGRVRHVHFSFDDTFVLSAGDDGNIFSFSCMTEQQIHTHTHATVPSPRAGLEMEKAVQDIEDPSAYSIETAKQKLELERVCAEAERRKQQRRARLEELQRSFQELLKENQRLPQHTRLHRSEFELDPLFLQQLEMQTEQRVLEVRRELAWGEEEQRIGLSKLQNMFWDSVVQDTLTVFACRSGHKISSYRLLALPFTHTHLSSQSSPEEAEPRQEHTHAHKHQSSTSLQDEGLQVSSAGTHTHTQKHYSRAAEKVERARAQIQTRRQQWAELYASKPSEDYEDPQDVEGIRAARENLGDCKLKSAEDFTVPEHLRMNVEKKRAQLLELERKIFEQKSEMNLRVLALRDQKVALLSELQAQVEQLQAIQQTLPLQKHCPLPALPVLLPAEVPERRHRYTRATLERFNTLRLQEEQDILELLEAQDTHTAEDTHTQSQDTHVVEDTHSQQEELTALEEQMRDMEEARSLNLQEQLLTQMQDSVCRFDAELCVLRHEKQQLDVSLKLADLRHVTLFEELLLLKDFQKREEKLTERLHTYRQEEDDIQGRMRECKRQMELRKRDIQRLQNRERSIAASFQTSLGENQRFEEFLTRVFKKKIKRTKKKETHTAQGGDQSEDEEDSDEDSDEESDAEDEDDYEESEAGAALDDSVCPPNCDAALFENTLRLRGLRVDVEEQLQDQMKMLDTLKKDCDTLSKKEKLVQGSRRSADSDLELLNREKQQRLNEVDVVLPLRLHQLECGSEGLQPADLQSALVLSAVELQRLQMRIRELQQEKSQQRLHYRHARQQHRQLTHQLTDMETRIRESEVRCEQLMLLKFGKLVQLEVLQTLAGNRKVEEMRQEVRERDTRYTQELKHWEAEVVEAKACVTAVMKLNTERLQKMNRLMTQKKTLDEELDCRQRRTVCQYAGGLVDEQELQRLQQLISGQSQDITALNEEIRALSRKDGHILPPLEPVLRPAHTHTASGSGTHSKLTLSSRAVK
ncbi:cilia- and flagella-associated protein 44 [Danio aesculapii]|uniref:cilia- and flagella-associated protein 44 n=1 Tax=Danio aesculapii TaxID=1142201 RepID=UPI0024C07311|nr:cilia- and flagella-associated protein 44 [Danio aesculapii]